MVQDRDTVAVEDKQEITWPIERHQYQ